MHTELATQIKIFYIRILKKLTQKLFSNLPKMKIVTSVLKSLVLVTALFSFTQFTTAKQVEKSGKLLQTNYTLSQHVDEKVADQSITSKQLNVQQTVASIVAESKLPSAPIKAGVMDTEEDNNNSLKNSINWLIFIIVILLTAVIVLVVDILGKVGDIQGKAVIHWNGINSWLMLGFGVIGLLLASWEFYEHGKLTVFNQEAASEHGPEYDNMFMITVVITGIVFVITQFLLFWYAYKYKHSTKRKALFYPDNHKIELLWTIVPAIVLTILVVRGLKTWTHITSNNDPKARVIEVFGYQFAWNARYAGEDNKLGKHDFRQIGIINALGVDTNDNKAFDDVITTELHLPVGEPVMLKFRAKDVIHSAYLPHFRTQMNVVPGLPTQFAFTPTITTAEMRTKLNIPNFDYVLLCNKICGSAHYRMKMKVVVHTKADFEKWMKEQPKLVNKSTPGATAAPADSAAMTTISKSAKTLAAN